MEKRMNDTKSDRFPIPEEEWRKIVQIMEGRANRAREVYEKRYAALDIPEEQEDIWEAGWYQGEVDALDDIVDFCYWWEHEREAE